MTPHRRWSVYGGREPGESTLNDSHGTANSESSGYHETITLSYVRLIANAFEAATGALPDRIAWIVGGPEGERDALLRYYSREALMSARARAEWVEPEPDTAALSGLSTRLVRTVGGGWYDCRWRLVVTTVREEQPGG